MKMRAMAPQTEDTGSPVSLVNDLSLLVIQEVALDTHLAPLLHHHLLPLGVPRTQSAHLGPIEVWSTIMRNIVLALMAAPLMRIVVPAASPLPRHPPLLPL